MRILVDINHPAHVHFFKNFIHKSLNNGNDIIVTASKKDIAINLLNEYKIKYTYLGSYGTALLVKLINIPIMAFKMAIIIFKHKPDVLIGLASSRICHAGWLFKKKTFVFTDTEHATEQIKLFKPFATFIITPTSFLNNLGKKHIVYNGYHELAYLHPNYFNPDISILKEAGLTKNDTFFIIRFVSWEASHDIGQKGFSLNGKKKLIKILSRYGKILITSENPLPEDLDKYRIHVSPTRIHDLLFYATMYIGEGGTMASEAAALGTPSIFISSLKLGYLEELEKKYDLIYSFSDEAEATERVIELLKIKNIKKEWEKKRTLMLDEKIDVTEWILNFLSKY